MGVNNLDDGDVVCLDVEGKGVQGEGLMMCV